VLLCWHCHQPPPPHNPPQLEAYHKPLKVLPRAQELWQYWHTFSDTHCMHGPNCTRRRAGLDCDFGSRNQRVQMISGAVLPIWKVSGREGRSQAWMQR
jgi:hypothetical protein